MDELVDTCTWTNTAASMSGDMHGLSMATAMISPGKITLDQPKPGAEAGAC